MQTNHLFNTPCLEPLSSVIRQHRSFNILDTALGFPQFRNFMYCVTGSCFEDLALTDITSDRRTKLLGSLTGLFLPDDFVYIFSPLDLASLSQ